MYEKLPATFGQFLLTIMKKLSAIFGHFSPATLHTDMKVFSLQTKISLFEDHFCCFWDQRRFSKKFIPKNIWLGRSIASLSLQLHISTTSHELMSRTNDNTSCLPSFKQSSWKISSLICYLFIKITHKFCRQIMKF